MKSRSSFQWSILQDIILEYSPENQKRDRFEQIVRYSLALWVCRDQGRDGEGLTKFQLAGTCPF